METSKLSTVVPAPQDLIEPGVWAACQPCPMQEVGRSRLVLTCVPTHMYV